MKKVILMVLMFVFVLVAAGCGSNISDDPGSDHTNGLNQEGVQEDEKQDNGNQDSGNQENESDSESDPLTVEETADEIVSYLSQKDMKAVSNFVHPTEGVRFTQYGYVNVEDDLVFSKEEVAGLMSDTTEYTWGVTDGKGDPIHNTFAEYYEEFVYDQEYLNAEEVAVDERLGQGNSLDNTSDVYPEGTVVGYHFSGFEEQYEGMDWKSLRIVLEEVDGQWVVVGIIHDQWTI